jgi:TonB family protein
MDHGMPKPLQSQDPNPKDMRFSTFGVLETGKRSPVSAITAIVVNVSLAALILYVGMLVKANPVVTKKITELTLPEQPVKEPPPPPKPPPPPPPKLPPPPKIESPKVPPPPEKVPEIKPIEVPVPKPVITQPAPPKAVTPPPAPKVVNLARATPASVPNHDMHPSAVRLGAADNPLKPTTGPSVAPVNFGNAGMSGMPKSNTGSGANATAVNLGSGSPGSHNMEGHDNKPYTVAGLANGMLGSNGPRNSQNIQNVALNTTHEVQRVNPLAAPAKTAKLPIVTYKPDPAYTADAKAMHLQGNVSLRIRVSANGAVQVLGVVQGLGHGLDESAIEAAKATRFRPAVDASGNPVDWEGVVLVKFQLS